MKDWKRLSLALLLGTSSVGFFWYGKLMVGETMASRSENIWLIIAGFLMMVGFAVSVFHAFIASSKRQQIIGTVTASVLFMVVVAIELRDSLIYTQKIEQIAWKTIHDLDRRRIIFFTDGSYRLEVQKMDKHVTVQGAWREDAGFIYLENDVFDESKGFFSPVYQIKDSISSLWLVPTYHTQDSVGVLQFERSH